MNAPPVSLDESIFPALRELREAGLEAPRALYLLGTGLGVGAFPSALEDTRHFALRATDSVPACWREAELITGRIGDLRLWCLADEPGGHEFGEDLGSEQPAWARAWPVWLARAAGAEVCVHTSAGVRVGGPVPGPPLGSLAITEDHLNLSGRSPLVGLGSTRLGPLFPDLTHLHDPELREASLSLAASAGIDAAPAITACTLGPALDTPAELGFYASAGAQVAVQGLADPLIACAHAGLALIAITAVTDDGTRPIQLPRMIELSEKIAPGLEDLALALAPHIAKRAQALSEDSE